MKNLSLWRRFCFALSGFKIAWQGEASFRLHAFLSLLELGILATLRVPASGMLVLLVSVGATLSFELANTALEYTLDLVHPNQSPSVKAAKDCAAGAVLLMSLVSGAITAYCLLIHFIGSAK